MPFTSSYEHLPRRNARSFDLDDSAAKAAAWVWHLHTSKPGVTTEGRFISSQSRRRSSSNYDRKATRFQQEASTTTTSAAAGGNVKRDTPLWDCGSNLYDTYELVTFGNRLDRSLMEAVPITPPQAAQALQEHHLRSPLHETSGILRTQSLPRSLSQEASKNHTPMASPGSSKFKSSNSYNNGGARASCSTGTAQRASAKWSRVGKVMNAIKRMVVLHKQVSLLGCKRSVNVIESSQRPLDPNNDRNDGVCARGSQLSVNDKVKANLSTSNFKSNECIGDEFSMQWTNSGTRDAYRLSIPSKDKSNYECDMGDFASMQRKIRACGSQSLGSAGGLSTRNAKSQPSSESKRDGLLFYYKKIRPRRKCVGDEMDDRIKGGNLEGVNVKERIRGANEHLDYHKHLHHHHHHHHHHYLHHNLVSESARLSPETMSKICAEKSWLI